MARSLIAQLAARHGPRASALDRRKFLQLTLAAGAGLLLSSAGTKVERPGRDSRKRVVVIGAGFGGLACAFELRAVGYDVVVLEARDRVGGRVLSFNAANRNAFLRGRNIEGGGELIGSNHPAWMSYAKAFKFDLLDMTKNEDPAVLPIVIDGRLLPFDESLELWGHMEDGLRRMNALASGVIADAPWMTPDAPRLDRTSTATWIHGLSLPEHVKQAMLINQVSDNGQAAEWQSLLGQLTAIKGGGLETFWTHSEVYRCRGGNDRLAHALATRIGTERVRLSAPVESVRRENGRLEVTTRDGQRLECDDVVLATPPSTWKTIEFRPSLPTAMRPQMGTNTKYLAHVKQRFWKKGSPPRSQYGLSNGLIQQTWDATDGQGAVDRSNDGACLTAFSGGPVVGRAEKLPPEDRDRAFASEYERLYPGFGANLVKTRYMDWPKDPWTRASYSFPAPGQVTTVGPLLASAHLGGHLHIAGEHACYQFVGYMEGALHSGAAVARRLAMRDRVSR
ncbi:MAG: FAD-dependent oxidoreductase [Candidatus Eisenbacteria bacterium]|uniref:FAD-dependent oxidoreductase n=1 Tax=Eiseniibacteriota bacterium TaxID=2212470 RepID=A0A849SPD5_UNCEI|nr:FAD-dependent oxidoreductase [Candidatus Eisenbacteria bacterium]